MFGRPLSALAAGALTVAVIACSNRTAELGFWFEPVTFDSRRTGPLTSADFDVVAAVARAELAAAFARLQIAVSDRRDAAFRVVVVQELHDLRFPHSRGGPAGESRAIPGVGGSGGVNFTLLASNAVGYAPAAALRAEIIAAIGRGIGRAAVHEFTHQLLPKAPIDGSTNSHSYEYRFAGRPQQYWGDLEWDLAWPLLQKRVGMKIAAANAPSRAR